MSALRVGTFNVLFGHDVEAPGSWVERRPLLRRAFEAARPDLLGLQEVFPSKLAHVAEDLGGLALIPGPATGPPRWSDRSHPYETVVRAIRTICYPRGFNSSLARSERAIAGELQPIAYRSDRLRLVASGAFWVSPSPEQPGSMLPLAYSPFLVHWARFTRSDTAAPVLVFNAHFGHAPWHHGATARIAARQIDTIASANGANGSVHEPPSVFLVGDFNAPRSSRLLRGLTSGSEARFVDGARAASERVGPPVTFHWGRGSQRLGLTIDYVLVKGPLSARRAEVVDVHDGRLYPSDHYPVVVEFVDAPRA